MNTLQHPIIFPGLLLLPIKVRVEIPSEASRWVIEACLLIHSIYLCNIFCIKFEITLKVGLYARRSLALAVTLLAFSLNLIR